MQQDDNEISGAKNIEPSQKRVIRDGFSMPARDYQLMLEIQASLLNGGVKATKSEVLRAALHVLKQLPQDAAAKMIGQLEPIKTGRPPGKK